MKKFLTIILVLVSIQCFAQENDSIRYKFDSPIDQYPQFPGGMEEMIDFFNLKIHYPSQAAYVGVNGKAFVSFSISETGVLGDFKIHKSSNLKPDSYNNDINLGYESLDNEALRVIKLMPNWTPAMYNGTAVKTILVILPFYFYFD